MSNPGKHAPASSKSFLVSLGTAVGGAVAALAVVVGIALVALNAGSDEPNNAAPTRRQTTPPPTTTGSASPSPSATGTPENTESPSGEAAAVGDTTLRVLNGNGTEGVAKRMADRAKAEGYPQPKTGNTTSSPKSTVFYAEGRKAEAEEFRRRFPEFTEIARAPSTFASDVMLTAVIGLDYPKATASGSPSP